MFGYVRVQPYELKVREYECYKAYYCGICKAMGKCTGHCSRLALNYDSVFLTLVRQALQNGTLTVKKERCVIHPFKKKPVVKRTPILDYTAEAFAILTHHKLLDDSLDESGFKRLRSFFARLLFGAGYRKARRKHKKLDQNIKLATEELHRMERSDENFPPEVYAKIFAKMLSAVFAEGLEGADARIASSVGTALGEWIYLTDALDDFETDRKHHRFNPLQRNCPQGLRKEDLEAYKISLFAILYKLENALLLLEYPVGQPEIKEILYNILYLGLKRKTEEIIQKSTVAP